MLEVMLLIYGFFVWLIFFKFRIIPVNGLSMAWVCLVGVFGIGFLFLLMALFQPSSKNAQFINMTTPIVPRVKGIVEEVVVKPNVPVKKGDILFTLDKVPFVNAVNQVKARLKLARTLYNQEKSLMEKDAGNIYDMQKFLADSERLEAELADAEYNLASTVVRAPSDGVATQVTLTPGVMAVTLPFKPVMIFVPDNKRTFIASYKQNVIGFMKEGDEVEMAFTAIPGKIAHGKVSKILPVMSEAQVQPGGQLISYKSLIKKGEVPVIIEISSDLSGHRLPGGSKAEVSVYTDSCRITVMLRRIVLRINSWVNYLPIELPGH